MNLKDCTDEEIISECFRRMYDNNSCIIAVKIWQLEDIKYEAGTWCTDEDAKEICEELNLDALTSCYDSEWSAIADAARDYKEYKEKKERNKILR